MGFAEWLEVGRAFGGWGVAGYFIFQLLTDKMITGAERDRLLRRVEQAEADKHFWQRAAFDNHQVLDRATALVDQFVRGGKQ